MLTKPMSLHAGIFGAIIGAVCCFTPLLVIVFGFAGISAWLGWIDYVLFPIMITSLGVVAHALYLRSGKVGPHPKNIIIVAVIAILALLFWLEFRFALRISIATVVAVAGYAFYLHRGKVAVDGANNKSVELEEKL